MIKESYYYYYYYRLTYLRMCPYDVNNNITKRPSTTNAIITPLTLTLISFAQTMRRLQQEEAYTYMYRKWRVMSKKISDCLQFERR